MAVLWELSLGGDRRPLRAWGLRGATFARRSFAADELRLQAPGRALAADPLFPKDSTVMLWRDGARVFTGRITSPDVYGSRATEGHNYVASGPWWFLDNLVYQEARYMAEDPTDADSPLQLVVSPRAVLFNTVTGGQQTAGTQIAQAIAFAAARGAGIAAGTISIATQPPWEEATSISCAEVIKRSVRYTPDAAGWFDYSGALAAFSTRRRGVLDAVTLDLGAGNRVVELTDLRPISGVPGVRFFYEDIVQLANGRTRARYRSQSAGNPNAVEAINEVVELGGQGGDNPEPLPPDLAAAVLSALGSTSYAGQIRLKGRDVVGDVAPGKVLNLSNGRAEWATMRALVETNEADLFTGEELVSFGPARFLGAAQLVEYLRYARLRNKTGYLDARRTGEAGTSAFAPSAINYLGGAGADKGFVEIELCGDSTAVPPVPARTIKVFAETVS